MRFSEKKVGEYNIIKFNDEVHEIDFEMKKIFEDTLNNSLKVGNIHTILDMTHIKYIDSSIIGSMVSMLTKYLNKSGSLSLLHINDELKEILISTKLLSFFKVFDSEEEILPKKKYNSLK